MLHTNKVCHKTLVSIAFIIILMFLETLKLFLMVKYCNNLRLLTTFSYLFLNCKAYDTTTLKLKLVTLESRV